MELERYNSSVEIGIGDKHENHSGLRMDCGNG